MLLSTILGTALGESVGYVLTALWTVLVVLAFTGRPRWFAAVGLGSALLIASGALVPLGVPGVDLANFIGYVLWSLWLIILAVLLIRGDESACRRTAAGEPGAGRLPHSATSRRA